MSRLPLASRPGRSCSRVAGSGWRPSVGPRIGQADVGVERDHRAAAVVGVLGDVVRLVTAQGGAGVPPPSDHVLLLLQRDPVPELDEHPDDADHLVAPAPGPWRLAVPAHSRASATARSWTSGLAIPSLKPNRLRGAPTAAPVGRTRRCGSGAASPRGCAWPATAGRGAPCRGTRRRSAP